MEKATTWIERVQWFWGSWQLLDSQNKMKNPKLNGAGKKCSKTFTWNRNRGEKIASLIWSNASSETEGRWIPLTETIMYRLHHSASFAAQKRSFLFLMFLGAAKPEISGDMTAKIEDKLKFVLKLACITMASLQFAIAASLFFQMFRFSSIDRRILTTPCTVTP